MLSAHFCLFLPFFFFHAGVSLHVCECVCVEGGITALSAQAAWVCVRTQASAVLLAQHFQYATLVSMLLSL